METCDLHNTGIKLNMESQPKKSAHVKRKLFAKKGRTVDYGDLPGASRNLPGAAQKKVKSIIDWKLQGQIPRKVIYTDLNLPEKLLQ